MTGITHLQEFAKPTLQGIVDATVENVIPAFADRFLPDENIYSPNFTYDILSIRFLGGNGILASEHLQYLEAGATLDATAFTTGVNGAGKLIARNLTTGKFEPFTAAEGFDNFSVLEYGYDNDGVNDVIAGSVIVRGSVYEAKLADAVTDEFKALTPMIRYVSHK